MFTIWQVDRTIVTVPEVFAAAATAPLRAAAKLVGLAGTDADVKTELKEFRVLQNITGTFRPGEITLVLAPPGHGKTALLKALAGVLPANSIEAGPGRSGLHSHSAPASMRTNPGHRLNLGQRCRDFCN
jgi:ABC-type molybdenum transport system ATPase subunit/photorepair protein PhrA